MLSGVLTSQPLWLGIGSEIVDGALMECGDTAYERQPIIFGEAYEDGNTVSVDSADDVIFAAWATDSPVPIAVWFITTVQQGDGDILASGEIQRVTQPLRGDTIRFWPGDLTISLDDEVPSGE